MNIIRWHFCMRDNYANGIALHESSLRWPNTVLARAFADAN